VSVTCTHATPAGLDPGYGDAGLVILDDFSGFANSGDVPFDLALAPDGGVVVAGQALSTNDAGQPELGFGDGGLVLRPSRSREPATRAARCCRRWAMGR
jgi:hypothetical protein